MTEHFSTIINLGEVTMVLSRLILEPLGSGLYLGQSAVGKMIDTQKAVGTQIVGPGGDGFLFLDFVAMGHPPIN
jgi:hypothetical protein